MSDILNTSLVAALMLVIAIVGGYLAKWMRVPRIVALIVGGVGLKFFILQHMDAVASADLVAPLRFVNELSLGLILFIIGGVFESARLKAVKGLVRRFSLYELRYTFLLTAVGCAVASWTFPQMSFFHCLLIGLLLGCAAMATAPAATWYVLQEYSAKGPTTDHLLVMTGINNLVSIISFHTVLILFMAFGWVEGITGPARTWWLDIFLVSFGSVGLGALLGYVLSVFHSRLPLREMILMFFATVFLLSAGDEWLLHMIGAAFNPMVTCLVMGVIFFRRASDPSHFEKTLETVSMPIFSLFFVLAGYNLHLEELSHLGVLGCVYLIARTWGKYWGVRNAVRRLGPETKVKENAGLGLLCQAGVAVFLGAFLVEHWQNPLAGTINTVILASVAICELVGPLLVKHVVLRAGEVKAVTLLRPGFVQHTWISPSVGLANLGNERALSDQSVAKIGETLTAKHLMRTNIHFLPLSASFDEILAFIEQSRFHDFPVVNADGLYMGMVHFRQVRDHFYSPELAGAVTAGALADKSTPAVTPDTELPQVLELFHQHNLGEIAVVNNKMSNQLLGIIEQRDLLHVLGKGKQ